MANLGSPLAMLDVVNSVENILTIRDGQIRCYTKDSDTGEWVPQSVVPTMSAPAAGFETFAVAVSDSTAASLGNHECFRMTILNHPDNTGWIWVGGSNVSAANGIPLAPGQTQELSLNNTGSVYAIAEVGSEKLIVAYLV